MDEVMDSQKSVTSEVEPEAANNDVPKASLTDGEDDLFCGPQKNETTEDCALTEKTQDEAASQTQMDCGSAAELDESALESSRSHTSQTPCSNGQKSKRPSSPGPHLVKETCVAAHSPNPKLTLCLSYSPRKGVSTPSDVEMLSPDSPVSKTVFVNSSADKDHDGSGCAEDSSFAKEPQQFVKDSDSGCLAKEKVHQGAVGTAVNDIAGNSGSSDMSQPGALFE
ncbi:uncharacterized protein LOC121938463, partial [Plectropomus leopardus]|uniref:uncharacterized protein LOC121938463 n=1 Tax=Plectropomus leopardus TaxID=160734 RepID=UPI001C4B916D